MSSTDPELVGFRFAKYLLSGGRKAALRIEFEGTPNHVTDLEQQGVQLSGHKKSEPALWLPSYL